MTSSQHKRPAILIVTTTAMTIQGFLLPFAKHFRNLGWRVDGMAGEIDKYPQCADFFDQVWDVAWSRNPLDPSNLIEAPKRIRETVSRHRYDIVHVHTPVAAFIVRSSLRNYRPNGLKVIYTAHGLHFYPGGPRVRNAVFLGLEKLAGKWTDYLVVINREDESSAKRHGLVAPDRVCYMPGIGVDTATLAPDRVAEAEVRAVRQELGLSDNDKLFLMVARLEGGKRHADCIRAFAGVDDPRAHLAFAGGGFLTDQMKKLADELHVSNRIRFLGHRRDVPALIRASAATLMTSEREGLSRSVMESLSLAVPVIGSDARGVADLISEGAGIVFRVGDLGGLQRGLKWVLAHPEKARKMGEVGRARMASHDTGQIIKLHEDLYSRALSVPRHTLATQTS